MKKYLKFSKVGFLASFQYKAEIYTSVISLTILAIMMFYFWSAVIESSTENLGGFTSEIDFLTYTMISILFSSYIYTDIGYEFSTKIKSGNISLDLIRPYNFIYKSLFWDIGFTRVFSLVITIIPIIFLTIFFNLTIPDSFLQIILTII